MFLRSLLALVVLGSIVLGQEKAEGTSTKVTGRLIFGKDLPAFEGQAVELLLFEYDPQLADAAAKLIDKVEIKDFKHAGGAETVKEFTLGEKGKIQPRRNYYVTAFVLKEGNRTHIGQADHVKEPFNRVLTNGQPRVVTIRFRPVR